MLHQRMNTLIVQLWTVATQLASVCLQEEGLTTLPFGEYTSAITTITFQHLAAERPPTAGVDRLLNLPTDD